MITMYCQCWVRPYQGCMVLQGIVAGLGWLAWYFHRRARRPGELVSLRCISNRRASLSPRNLPALWRSGTKATSVAILLVRQPHRHQRPTPHIILALAVRWTRVAARALRMLDWAYLGLYGLYEPIWPIWPI